VPRLTFKKSGATLSKLFLSRVPSRKGNWLWGDSHGRVNWLKAWKKKIFMGGLTRGSTRENRARGGGTRKKKTKRRSLGQKRNLPLLECKGQRERSALWGKGENFGNDTHSSVHPKFRGKVEKGVFCAGGVIIREKKSLRSTRWGPEIVFFP